LRGLENEYKRRNAQPLLVLAQQPFQLKRPKECEKRWAWPAEIPTEVLFDPLSTVSATYGVAFQTQFRDENAWSSRPTVFVIDRDGVLRYVDSHLDQDIREEGILPALDDIEEQRKLITALQKEDALREAARTALAPIGADTKAASPPLARALKDEAAQVRAGPPPPCTGSPRRPRRRSLHSARRSGTRTAAFAGSAAWRWRGWVRRPGRPCRHSSRR
jgi:peroxiredoxin